MCESVCVGVCVRERERDRDKRRERVCVKGWEKDGKDGPNNAFWTKAETPMETLEIKGKYKWQVQRGLWAGT